MTRHIIADDLFAGAGGWDIGAAALGITARGVEIMPEARLTREAAGMVTVHDDVWTFEPDGKADLLIASPPCQTFSTAGNGSGRKALDALIALIANGAHMHRELLRGFGERIGDERTALALAPLHFAMTGNYRRLAFEQVPTVLPLWEVCAETLRRDGWHVWTGMLHAEQYGVGQTRKRAMLLASLDGPVSPPKPTNSRYHTRTPEKIDEGLPRWLSMAEVLGHGMTHRPYPTIACSRMSGGPDKEKVGGSASRANIYAELDAGRWQVMPTTRSKSYRRPGSPTLTFGHDAASRAWAPVQMTPEEVAAYKAEHGRSVRITLEEAAALQGFPPMEWCGDTSSMRFAQIGNAVPPPLAMHALAAVTR